MIMPEDLAIEQHPAETQPGEKEENLQRANPERIHRCCGGAKKNDSTRAIPPPSTPRNPE